MSEVKDPAIKLFGRTISLTHTHINDSSSSSAPARAPSSSSSPREVTSSATQQQHEPEVGVVKVVLSWSQLNLGETMMICKSNRDPFLRTAQLLMGFFKS